MKAESQLLSPHYAAVSPPDYYPREGERGEHPLKVERRQPQQFLQWKYGNQQLTAPEHLYLIIMIINADGESEGSYLPPLHQD